MIGINQLDWHPTNHGVQLAHLTPDVIVLRHTDRPDDGHVVFTPHEIRAFLQGAKAGEFDDFAQPTATAPTDIDSTP